jgi:hypothetical protein
MARPKSVRPLKRIAVRVYEQDYIELKKFATEQGVNFLIREILRFYVREAGDRLRQKLDAIRAEEEQL